MFAVGAYISSVDVTTSYIEWKEKALVHKFNVTIACLCLSLLLRIIQITLLL